MEAALRAELHEQQMEARRGGASVEYIKNLVLKYMELEDEEHEALFPALAMCLQFNEQEVLRVAQVREERRPGFLASVFHSGGRRATPARGGVEGAETRLLKARAQEESRAQARAFRLTPNPLTT